MLHCGRFMKRIISKQDGLCFLCFFVCFFVEIIQDHRRAEDSNSRLQQIGQFVQKHLLFSFFFFHFSNWYCFTQLILLTKRANIVVCFLLKRHLSLFSNDEHRYQHFHVKKCINFFLDSIIGIILLEISSKSLLFCKRI